MSRLLKVAQAMGGDTPYRTYYLRKNKRYNGNWWERAKDDIMDGVADVDPVIFTDLLQEGSCVCDEDEAELFLRWAESVPEWQDESGQEAVIAE